MSGAPAKPPLLILGGSSNALAMARNMTRYGVNVYLSTTVDNPARHTRCQAGFYPVADKTNVDEIWSELLFSGRYPELEGAVLFPCNDDGVEFLGRHRAELLKRYRLDDSDPDIHLAMLNKLTTLEWARQHGIPVPRWVNVEGAIDPRALEGELELPVIIKPHHSHLFQKAFGGKKLFQAHTKEELDRYLEMIFETDLKVIISEWVQGPDTLLSSYYTYLTPEEEPLFHYTKRVIRRFPKNNGQGCLHITRWEPRTAELGLRFFKAIKLRGLGNIEFKHDLRDDQLKVIECNPRFTAAHELLVRSAMPIDIMIYNHIVGLPVPVWESFKEEVTLLFPRRDWLAYKELAALGELTFGDWAKSLLRPHVLPHFQWRDPMPTVTPFLQSVRHRLFG